MNLTFARHVHSFLEQNHDEELDYGPGACVIGNSIYAKSVKITRKAEIRPFFFRIAHAWARVCAIPGKALGLTKNIKNS